MRKGTVDGIGVGLVAESGNRRGRSSESPLNGLAQEVDIAVAGTQAVRWWKADAINYLCCAIMAWRLRKWIEARKSLQTRSPRRVDLLMDDCSFSER